MADWELAWTCVWLYLRIFSQKCMSFQRETVTVGVPAASEQADPGLLKAFWLKAALGTVVQRPGELQVGCALGAAVSDVGIMAGGAS